MQPRWTSQETAFLRTQWPTLTLKQIASATGRTYNAVQNKARSIGLPQTEPKAPRAPLRDKIIDLLNSKGPLPIAEIAEALGHSHDSIFKSVRAIRASYPKRFFRIVAFLWPDQDKGGAQAPVYSAEGGEDVQRPRVKKARRNRQKRESYQRHKARISASRASVKNAEMPGTVNPWMQLAPPGMRTVMSKMRSVPAGVAA